jgi:hypothetical protein
VGAIFGSGQGGEQIRGPFFTIDDLVSLFFFWFGV